MTIKDTAGLCCFRMAYRPSCRNPCREIAVHFQEDPEAMTVPDSGILDRRRRFFAVTPGFKNLILSGVEKLPNIG